MNSYEFYYESETASGYVRFLAASMREAQEKAREWAAGKSIEYVGQMSVNS